MRGERVLPREYLEALLIAVIFATFARTFVVQAFKIPTASMEENLLIGDHILVNKFIYGPTVSPLERWLLPQREVRRGDVVVFRYPRDPRRDFIKRCVGLPGDVVEIVDKELRVNGEAVNDGAYTYHSDPRIFPSSRFLAAQNRHRDNFGPHVVPAEEYFFLGDNRDNSNDSRVWGDVPRENLRGRAVMVFWSFEPQETERTESGRAWSRLEKRWRVLTGFFSGTRWERTFHVVR